MGVPAHDQRDFDFAKKYNLEIKQVVSDGVENANLEKAYIGGGKMINSSFLDNLDTSKAKQKITNSYIAFDNNKYCKEKTKNSDHRPIVAEFYF